LTERETSGRTLRSGPSTELEDILWVGYVAKAHGLTGEVEVRPDWAESSSLVEARQLVLEKEQERRVLDVVRSRKTPKGILVLLAGVSDRTAAEGLRGYRVGVSRGELPGLAEGEYYLSDLVGLEVVGPEGRVGVVLEVQIYPSVDAIVIETTDGGKLEQPLLDEWISNVDLTGRTVVLSSLDGLIEVPRASAGTLEAEAGDDTASEG
jgi:16S rRNA processing protein RimM